LLRRTSEQLGRDESSAELVDPFEMTGFRVFELGEEPSEPRLAHSPSTGRFEQAPSTGRSDRPEQPRDWSRPLAVGLDTAARPLPLDTSWAQFVEELRQETLAESDVRLRSSYLVMLASVLRLHGDVGETAAARLEEAGARAERPVRTLLLNLLVKHWEQPSERFIELLERLEAWDEGEQPNTAAVRRASIVVERLLGGGLDARIEEQLERKLTSPETLPGLTLRAIRAHRDGHRSRAAHMWRQVSRHLRDDPREVLVDAAAYFLRGTPGFFDYLEKRLQTTQSSRILWLMMQREAAAVGDHLREAVALKYLVAADVALGRRLGDDSAARRKRLKQIAAARFFRLATLLRGLGQAQRSDDVLGKLEPHGVMRDAVSLAPRRPLYLRRLARWSRARGDLNNCARSLGSLAMSYEDDRLAALACTELARTIFIGGGRPEMVDQYLDEAIAHDGGCKSARFARALRLLAAGDEAGYETFVAGSPGDVGLVDLSDDERALAAAEDFSELARVLEHKLEHAVEPMEWATLTFRLSQLHAWHLSPTPDARLRVEFLEQVLIADEEHLDAWLEILELRLARREYAQAAKALERLADLSDVPAERAGWLTELAGLCEHFLGTPAQAFDYFGRAAELAADNPVAFFGALRTDVASSADAVGTIVERLDAGVGVRESQELALELVLRVDEAPAAWEVLDERFLDQPFWMFVRICTGIERGLDDPETVERLWDMWTHPSVEPLLAVFERFFEADQVPPRAKLIGRLNQIKGSPVAEGRLVRAMYDVRHRADAELEGVLAAMRARRCTDAISRATDLMVMAISFLWRGEYEQALRVCEHLLERHPDFLPALKLAKIGNDKLGRWAALARVCEREAERTGVAQIAFEDRLVASDVQRNHLGDFDAACQQYHAVLLVNPGHREAFDKLKPLLLQRGEVEQLIELYERRLSHANASGERSVAEQCELLNEMADIALHRGKDVEAAIDYFRRSLDLEPDQLRSLRILAELYQNSDRLEAALECYRRAAELTDNQMLVERLWVQMAELLEAAGRD
ncbi:MAG: tetratricopeptide repeat protein, partial [Persicimonas sp.]